MYHSWSKIVQCGKKKKINGNGDAISTHITPELNIEAPVYVDDILGIGDCKTVEKVIRNSETSNHNSIHVHDLYKCELMSFILYACNVSTVMIG